MRKIAMVVSALAIVGSMGLGRADNTLATCTGSFNLNVGCSAQFTLGGTTSVTISLTPGLGFTGTLSGGLAHVGTHDGGCGVKAEFVGGFAVPDAVTQTVDKQAFVSLTCKEPAGTWKAYVVTYATYSPSLIPAGNQSTPNFGYGSAGVTASRSGS